jgi:chromate transporter
MNIYNPSPTTNLLRSINTMHKGATKTQRRVIEVFKTFLKLGLTSFGGPVAHLGYFRKELVEKQHWVSESQYGQLLAICQFLPGPASSQLGFALGLLRAGWLGGIAAFVAFTLPSALLMIGFAKALPLFSGGTAQAAIHGLKLVAAAVVADAVFGMFKKLCPDATRRTFALLATCALLVFPSTASQLLIISFGALGGMLLCTTDGAPEGDHIQVTYRRSTGLLWLGIAVFLFVVFTLVHHPAWHYAIAQTFYRAGALVFGGGHVVLPLLEDAVVSSGGVSAEHFLAGYGAAQVIPGPMFAFSAYLGALIPGSGISLLGAAIALIFMFLPGFLLIAAALPLSKVFAEHHQAANAIAGVNAVIVGVLGAALYDPILQSAILSVTDVGIVAIAIALLTHWKRSALNIVIWCVLASIATH